MALIAGVVLGAGASTRMGRPKMVLPVSGGTLLAAAVTPLLDAGLDFVVVVLGPDADAVQREAGLPRDTRLRIVVNAHWASGLSSSLRCGLEACVEARAALVALGDQPGRTAQDVRRIVEACRPGVPLAVPVHGGRAGHPVAFARTLWDELKAQSGDVGGRAVVRRHWAEAVLLECPPCRDVDTPEDYQRLVEGGGEGDLDGLPRPDRDGR